MIGDGKFHATLNEAADVLKSLGLLKERNVYQRTRLGAADLAGLDYPEMWKALVSVNDYDIRLKDDSIMSFWRSSDGGELRFWWFEAPVMIPQFDVFARKYLRDSFQSTEIEEDLYQEWLPELEDEIQEAFDEDAKAAPLRNCVTPLRYEYKPEDYTEGLHPASHLHVGNDNSIRLSCKRVLTPLSFVLMVLRQCYPDHWALLLANGVAEGMKSHVKDGQLLVSNEFWKAKDLCELWLE